jgi:hypothetical protein
MRFRFLGYSFFLDIGPGMNWRDRWSFGVGNSIYRAWSMPRWMSFRKHDGRLRGG